MGYELINAIEECINYCKNNCGGARVRRFDENNNCTLWLEADWVELEEDQDTYVIELYFCYSDTGRIAYSQKIYETIEVR